MKVVDAHTGALMTVGVPFVVFPDEPPITIVAVKLGGNPLTTRIAVVKDAQGNVTTVPMPVKYLPKLIYGKDFPVSDLWCCIFPS